MRIAVGNDHAAIDEKSAIVDHLTAAGHDIVDRGVNENESVDYPDFAAAVSREVASGGADLGILVCGTGIGMSIAANKIAGIRAALCHSAFTARMAREHNDANVLCLGARVLEPDAILEAVDTFLGASFEGGRHARRVGKIGALEGGDQAADAAGIKKEP